MALFTCPKCGAEISTEARKCPQCELENPWTVKCEAQKIANQERARQRQEAAKIGVTPPTSSSSSSNETKTVYVVKEGQNNEQSCGQTLQSIGCLLTVFVTIPALILMFFGL